jgi:hypothetical protein
MKNAVAVALAMGVALVSIPSALADSFGYKASGSNVVANLNTNPSHTGFGTGVADNGAVTERNGSQVKPGRGGRDANNAGSIVLTGDGGVSLDRLLNSGKSSTERVGKGDAAADAGSNELSLLSGGLGVRKEIGAPGSGHFYFADKGSSHANPGVPKGAISQASTVVALAETPEPGSLFLLGTGLLCMALALFWKSAKRPAES